MSTATDAVAGSTGGASAEAPPLLQLRGVTKLYPGVRALDAVDFELRSGEVHVLFGENGAGKSTLISLVAGAGRPTEGEILVQGRPTALSSVHDARQRGISAVFQEFSLVPQLTVAQNLFLGAEPTRGGLLDVGATNRRAAELLGRLGFVLPLGRRVAFLSRAERQMVEIAKAFRSALSILILDEPTASLTERETDRLFALIEQVKRQGVGVIYITHRMAEIRRIGDRITVLRDGRYVATVPAATTSEDDLVRLMTGRVISQIFPTIQFRPTTTVLETQGLGGCRGTFTDVSLSVRSGEIVGLAGLVGSGKSEIARACFGAEPVLQGRVLLDGRDVTGLGPRAMLDRGFYYVPADRREEGLVMMRSVRENVSLPALGLKPIGRGPFLRVGAEAAVVRRLAGRLNLQPPRVEREVDHFSGGNQQKVMLAKPLTRDVRLYVFDEPTVGVDVGTRSAIYEFIRDLCEAGAAILLVSSDLPEILHLCNRAYVVTRGRIRCELTGAQIEQETILRHFFEKEQAA